MLIPADFTNLLDSHENQDSGTLPQGQDVHGWIQSRSPNVYLHVCKPLTISQG